MLESVFNRVVGLKNYFEEFLQAAASVAGLIFLHRLVSNVMLYAAH